MHEGCARDRCHAALDNESVMICDVMRDVGMLVG